MTKVYLQAYPDANQVLTSKPDEYTKLKFDFIPEVNFVQHSLLNDHSTFTILKDGLYQVSLTGTYYISNLPQENLVISQLHIRLNSQQILNKMINSQVSGPETYSTSISSLRRFKRGDTLVIEGNGFVNNLEGGFVGILNGYSSGIAGESEVGNSSFSLYRVSRC